LFAITRNRCLSALRAPSPVLDDDEDALWQIADPATRVDVRLEEEEHQRLVLELIQRELEQLEQDALWLRCHERMPVEEITRVLQITQSSGARGVLQSARRKLRAALERRAADKGTGQ
jgi:DNA-directed RNA polymerase specialized sigma24 family protein